MKPILNVKSELEAVNYLLRASGELEVSSLDVSSLSPEAETVLKYIQRQRESILEKGWAFNTRKGVVLPFDNFLAQPELNILSEEEAPYTTVYVNYGSESFLLTRTPTDGNEMFYTVTVPNYVWVVEDEPYTSDVTINLWLANASEKLWLVERLHDTNATEEPLQGISASTTTIPDIWALNLYVTPPLPPVWDEVNQEWIYEEALPVIDYDDFGFGVLSVTSTPTLVNIHTEAIYEDRIPVPASALDISVDRRYASRYVFEPDYLLDLETNSYNITETPTFTVVSDYDFDSLNAAFREWITYSAGYEYFDQVVGDDKVAQSLAGLALRGAAAAKRWDTKTGRFSARR